MTRSLEKHRTCIFCGNILENEKDYFQSPKRGGYVCASCEKYTSVCVECGIKELNQDLFKTANGERICGSCLDKKYTKCYLCGRIYRKNEIIVGDGKFFCEYCFKITFVKCHKCKKEINGLVESIKEGLDHYKYCNSCFNKIYRRCSHCHRIFYLRNGRFDENGDFLCFNCFRRTSIIHEYSYLPKLNFWSDKKEKNVLFMGMELEVGKTKYDENIHPKEFLNFLKKMGIFKFYFLKRDSSISAFEIVSHPFTLLFAKKNMKINDIIKWLTKKDYNLSNCGFHIHLDRNYFCESDIIKMRIFFSRFKDNLYLLSGRETPDNKFCLYEKYCFKKMNSLSNQRGRHCAFNINTNKSTVEVRIFKGTFNYDLILAYLEFCQCLSGFVKSNTVGFTSHQKKKIWEEFIRKSKKFHNLYKLLKEKELTKCV